MVNNQFSYIFMDRFCNLSGRIFLPIYVVYNLCEESSSSRTFRIGYDFLQLEPQHLNGHKEKKRANQSIVNIGNLESEVIRELISAEGFTSLGDYRDGGIGLLQGKSSTEVLGPEYIIPGINEKTLADRAYKIHLVLGFVPDESISKVFESEKAYYNLQRLRENPPG